MYKVKTETDSFGNKYYYLNNLLHREDGPAIEYTDGSEEWYKNGKLHREDGPAIKWVNGPKFWHLNGKRYGYNDNFTNESWIKFVNTLIFS